MIRELSWYLEGGRFASLAEEMERSLRRYGEAKKAGMNGEALGSFREDARSLFEDHCVRSGLRAGGTAYINIDAEFFNGNTLDETAMDNFIKNVIKGYCYQKVLWTYMGTTGLLTAISKAEMAKAGLEYDDYLPLEYKKGRPAKKPLGGRAGKDMEIFYQYGDGTISREYMPEKAKMRFDRLEDTSGVDWDVGYDPNGRVKKDGWHGDYDRSGNWVRVEEQWHGGPSASQEGMAVLELIRDGDGAILYDPGMLLLTAPLLLYVTEEGEPYGELSMDRDRTVKEIDKALKKIGASGISAVGGIAANRPELLAAYREVLGPHALPDLRAMGGKEALTVREVLRRKIAADAAEGAGIKLEKKLSVAGQHCGGGTAVLTAVAAGSVAVPLSPRKPSDGLALGLSREETDEMGAAPVKTGQEELYDAVLSNLYASWPCYAGALDRLEAAEMVRDYFDGKETVPETIEAQTTVGEIIHGGGAPSREGISLYSSGIPGVFCEPEAVNFYDGAAKEKFLRALERKRVLPKGGAAAALTALQSLPEGGDERRSEINRSLTRALGEYKAISASTGMPLAELIAAAKGEGTAALGKKVYYELAVPELVAAAGKENRQRREISLGDAAEGRSETIIIGSASGPALDEVLLTRELLKNEYAFSDEEAGEALDFLHGIRLAPGCPAFPPPLLEALAAEKPRTATGLRGTILKALDGYEGANYNLASETGLEAYIESGRAKVSKKEIQVLLRSETGRGAGNAAPPSGAVAKVEIKYRDEGAVIPSARNAPRGTPERVLLAGAPRQGGGPDVAGLAALSEEALEMEYGYPAAEAREAAEYLRSIEIPAGGEGYFTQNLLPLFTEALKGTNKAAALKEGIQALFCGVVGGDAGPGNEAGSPRIPVPVAPLIFGSGAMAAGSHTIGDIGAFSEETLRENYGYPVGEAEAAVEYLRSIKIPAGTERYVMRDIVPVFSDLVRGSGTAAELKERIAGAFAQGKIPAGPGADYTPVRGHHGGPGAGGNAETAAHEIAGRGAFYAVPVPPSAVPFETVPAGPGLAAYKGAPRPPHALSQGGGGSATNVALSATVPFETVPTGPGSGFTISRKGFSEPGIPNALPMDVAGFGVEGNPAANLGGYKANKAVPGGNSAEAHGDTATGDMAGYRITEGLGAVVSQPRNTARDAEIERLRKKEANFERDKAEMARQGRPALARSESRDVGHAEGAGKQIQFSLQEERKFLHDFKEEVKDELRLMGHW